MKEYSIQVSKIESESLTYLLGVSCTRQSAESEFLHIVFQILYEHFVEIQIVFKKFYFLMGKFWG